MIRNLAGRVARKLARSAKAFRSPLDLNRRVAALEAQLELAERHHTNAFWRALDVIYDQTLGHRILVCTVCGHSAKRNDYAIRTSRCMFGGGKLERYQCPRCDCIFGPQKFLDQDPDFIDLDYRLLYSRYAEQNTTANEVRTFGLLKPEPEGVYLNWGCGAWNDTIVQLRASGWNVSGYEPSASASGPFIATSKEALPAQVDGILSNNVIEHFTNPVAKLHELGAMLKPGGRMAHSSPCYEYRYEGSRFHTTFLLGRSPQVLAERTGFEIIDRVEDGEYMAMVFQKR